MKKTNKKGITLIALIITIIVLLILAGITISLTIGDRGIVNKAQQAGIKTEEAVAREKLELVLIDMQADKVTNIEYNENEYLTRKIEENKMVVNGDIVFVDGWQFQIDRSVPKISASLGKGKPNEEIKITASQTVSADYTKSTIKAEIEYTGEITYIQIAGEEIEVPLKQGGKYIIEKEVTKNGTYSVLVKDIEDKYQIASISVTEISEDMVIRTPEELVAFRDRVNKGATYAGRTITLGNDIDLSTVCGPTIGSWTPIGDYGTNKTHIFSGTFEGNNHTINNLYINTTSDYQGLFGYVDSGYIKNLEITGKIDKSNLVVGSIVAYIDNTTIENCINRVTSTSNYTSTGYAYTGGIVGRANNATIKKCINYANINNTTSLSNGKNLYIGGIVGNAYNTIIEMCINYGNVTCVDNRNGTLGGIAARADLGGKIDYCANYGTISGGQFAGGITAAIWDGTLNINNTYNVGNVTAITYASGFCAHMATNININKCYNKGIINGTIKDAVLNKVSGTAYVTNTYYLNTNSSPYGTPQSSSQLMALALTLGDAFTSDIQNENGTWKYNDGYPILKWQLEK